MSNWISSIMFPRLLQPGRYNYNGQIVDAMFNRMAGRAMNHCSAYRRKFLAAWQQSLIGDAGNGTFGSWRGFVHTGHHCAHLEVIMLLLRPDGGADPHAYVTITPDATGIISDTSDFLRHSLIDATSVDQPDHWVWGRTTLNAADDTDYWLHLNVVDEARVLSVCVFEVGTTDGTVDDTVTGVVNPIVSVGDPIFDDQQDDLAVGLGELLRTNRSHMFSWGSYDGFGNSVVGAAWANVIDTAMPAINAASPGFVWESEYHNTYSRTDVPVVLAVYATRSAGIGGQTGEVKIDDGAGNIIAITGIVAAGWYTQAGTLPAAAATKYDVQARAPTGGTVRVDAVSVYEYE